MFYKLITIIVVGGKTNLKARRLSLM